MEGRGLARGIVVVLLIVLLGGLVWYETQLVKTPTTATATAPTAEEPAATPAAPAGTETAAAPGATETPAADQPAAAATETAAAPAATETPAGTTPDANATPSGTDVAMATPGDQPAANPAPNAMPGPQKAPGFDVVRVEPTGDTVMAGTAEPNSTVEVLDGQTTIATTTTNEQGDWAISLEQPLDPGSHDLAVRATSPDKSVQTLSDQRVAVSVPQAGSKDVLVVMNTPSGASKVLQVPETGSEVANAPASGTGAPTESGSASDVAANTPAGSGAAPAAPSGADVAMNKPAGSEATPAAPAAGAAEPATGTGGDVAMATPEAGGAGTVAGGGTEAAPAATPEAGGAPTVAGTGTDAGTMNPSAATETQTAEAPAATEPSAADAGATTGKEAEVAMTPPAADNAPGTTDKPKDGVAAAAEPEIAAEPPVATEAPVATEPPATTMASNPPAAEPAAPAPPPPEPKVIVSAVEADSEGNVFIAGTATTPEAIRAYIDDKPVGEASPSPSGTYLITTARDLPAGTYVIRVDQLGKDGQVIARSEVPFEKEIAVALLKPAGTADASGGAAAGVAGTMPEMETVIIKRRDTLWHIARKTFGHGIRWSTIYQANTDQIRNPHWIYPGQVFVMPKGSTKWED